MFIRRHHDKLSVISSDSYPTFICCNLRTVQSEKQAVHFRQGHVRRHNRDQLQVAKAAKAD